MTPVTWGLTHSGLGSLSRTDFLPVRHTETLCVSCSARRHRPVPWPHVRPGWAASCAVSPSHGLTPFRPPSPHPAAPRRSRTEAPPSRPAPVLVSVQVSRAEGVSGACRLLKQKVPPLLPNCARPGLESRPQDAQVQGQGTQRRAGAGARKTPGQDAGAGGAEPGLRHPPRQ